MRKHDKQAFLIIAFDATTGVVDVPSTTGPEQTKFILSYATRMVHQTQPDILNSYE